MKYILNDLQKLWLKELGISEYFLKTKNINKSAKCSQQYLKENSNKLKILQETVNHCNKCQLNRFRKNTVFGIGLIYKPEVFIIGEAPGENEDLMGLPFVGKSGKLLDNMLKTINLSRDKNIFITNIIKCRPQNNRNPKEDEIQSCINYLHEQIKIIQPKKILILGKIAANNIIKKYEKISNIRGKIYNYEISKSYKIPIVVTFHPSYLLRYPEEKKLALLDLILLNKI
ncbi:hypothetical protein CKSOR_00463 [Candidatus Kinetoplastibacterium sorsogonicusi]|uniref:Type-4 uracil-DNA glycosylase n=1 Tax=Candidatus Kinetoplastidibacterium kentomonadis TaxID=1576550 RepID=A0A3Q8F3R7_9PROT|nr:uracil-DNA glycosylase [Candidatus Kinetoplastibacterium sorsogonicusi]AWD32575.1 hypothetical protein CKSOR_00463 [Candidatus Kinetoplastibacterium sorsogonicusi]